MSDVHHRPEPTTDCPVVTIGPPQPLSVVQAREQVLQADSEKLAALQRLIDQHILRYYEPGGEVYVSLGTVSPRILAELQRRYEHAGWCVTPHRATDQRDEDALRLRDGEKG